MAPEVLPMRPMTAGELLDAGTALLRRRAWPLLAVAAPLAAAEQLILAGLRERAGLTPPAFLPEFGDLGGWWLVVAAGFGMEAVIVALLGGYAGVAAGSALTGARARLLTRPAAVLAAAVVSGVVSAFAAYFGFVPWLIVYGLIGMATPALTLGRTRHPFRRSARLATRDGLRPALIRLLGYGSWFVVRFALGTGWVAIASQIGWTVGDGVVAWVVPIAWGLANTVAYPALACLDAAMLVETRIRSEGLDIEIGRERARGGDGSAALVDAA
ncbi:hypothetical protein AB0C07_39315 [Actinoplanes missouriensis]|uniref:hypothetical protein n=1 Tax=Actinoplanes missouriensis TaxID=1866 RepID=UPI00340F1E49